MAGSVESTSPPPLDEKLVLGPRKSSEIEGQHSHQEVVYSSSNDEALNESDHDVPVRTFNGSDLYEFADMYLRL